MAKHIVTLTDEDIRMIMIGLDTYSQQWEGYVKRRERCAMAMTGIRVNSAEEKQAQELMRTDVLSAGQIVKNVCRLRDHLACLIKPSRV